MSRHDTASPSPMASATGGSTSATLIMTGVVRPRVTASSESTAAHMPRRGDRSGCGALTTVSGAASIGPRRP